MSEPIKLIQPEPNKDAAKRLREIADQIERGEFTGIAIVKLDKAHSFATECVGAEGWSQLQMIGAMTTLIHDLMHAQ